MVEELPELCAFCYPSPQSSEVAAAASYNLLCCLTDELRLVSPLAITGRPFIYTRRVAGRVGFAVAGHGGPRAREDLIQ